MGISQAGSVISGFVGLNAWERLQRVLAEAIRTIAVSQLCHHFALDLADAFAGKPKFTANLVERARDTVVQAITQTDDILLAFFQGFDDATDVG